MSVPLGVNQAAYQKRIDDLVGTTDGRPRIKLEWGPRALTWTPHKLGTEPPGYTFPIFYAGKDEEGNYLSAERWVLLERIEWGQYAPTWEAVRYKKHDGAVWDLKGPCPNEKYVELYCHSYHNGKCCPCLAAECKCAEHCWGYYADPDEHMFNWIRRVHYESQRDPDVDPHADIRFFEAPHAQQELRNEAQAQQDREKVDVEQFDREAVDLYLRAPHTVSSKKKEIQTKLPVRFKKDKSGLYLPN